MDERFEPVRMDELRAGDRIVQGHSVGRTIIGADGQPVDVTYEVTGAVGSHERYPDWLWVEPVDPAPDPAEAGGFFSYERDTVMYRVRPEPGR